MTDLILMAVACLFLWGGKSRKSDYEENLLSIEQTTAFRGMAAIGIVLHHISFHVDGMFFPMLKRVGFLISSLFLFWAGYGLRQSLKRNKNYLVGFFRKRFLKILIPFFVAGIMYLLYHLLFTSDFSAATLIPIRNGQPNLLVDNSWYVISLLFFYVVFYFAYRCLGGKGDVAPLIAVGICLIVYTILLKYVFQWGSWWVNSAFAFFLGLLVATYEKQFLYLLRRWYWASSLGTLFLFVVVTGLTVFKLAGNQTPIKIAFDWGACSFLCLTLIACCYKFRFGNGITAWLGKISYEIYLLHGLAIRVFTEVIPVSNNAFFIVAVLLLSVLLAHGFNLLNRKVLLKKI